MQNDLDTAGSPKMDANMKNQCRGLQSSNSNNVDKNIRESARPKGNFRRRGNNPRGSYDVPPYAQQPPPAHPANNSENFRKFRDQSGRQKHQRPQNYNKNQPQNSSKTSGDNDAAASFPVTLEDEFEVGSVFNHGSKKHNINHLLNFQFEPRGTKQHQRSNIPGKTSSGRKNKKFFEEPAKPKYNKEQYLQANCQFVVKDSGDYTVHLADPDVLVDWDLVEQVNLKTTASVPSCPICLYPPKAAKIARCGHVFCWPCILHYLALSDHAWRKCPICYEAIHRPDLKSVISIPWKEFQINDEIELCLMRRERNSLFAMPVDQYFPEVNEKHPYVDDKYTGHSNLNLASPRQVVRGIIARERYELEAQYREDKDEPEACFIEEALQYLSQRESGIGVHQQLFDVSDTINEETCSSDDSPDPESNLDSASLSLPEDLKEESSSPEESRPRQISTSSEGTIESLDQEDDDQITAEDLDIETKKSNTKQQAPKETFYFYQSSDGQPIFLHALNVQMLVHEYGSLENCPKKISGKIIEKDNTSMSEGLRNRLRYLRHMPLTSIFEVCEIQLKVPFISRETLNEFSTDLESRRRKRNRRAREERRREKWIEVEENKKLGKYPEAKCRIESAFHFPQVGAAVAISSARSNDSLNSVDSSQEPNLGLYGSSHEGSGNDSGFSFAKMLKQGPASASSRSYTAPKPVLNLAPKTAAKNEDSEPEPEDYVPPPPKASLGDALAAAFAQATTVSGGENNGTSGSKKSSKKNKRMKGQKIVLTGSARPMMD